MNHFKNPSEEFVCEISDFSQVNFLYKVRVVCQISLIQRNFTFFFFFQKKHQLQK